MLTLVLIVICNNIPGFIAFGVESIILIILIFCVFAKDLNPDAHIDQKYDILGPFSLFLSYIV